VDPYHLTYVPGYGPDRTNIDIADIDNLDFSWRFTQLLNTYILDYTAPLSIIGTYWANSNMNGTGWPVNITTAVQSFDQVLEFDPAWLAVLTSSSLITFALGIATAILNLKRRGPEILDSFTSMLRDNPYAHEVAESSIEDSCEKVRRLRRTRVMLGGVRPLEAIGYVAVTTRTDGDSVQPLRSVDFTTRAGAFEMRRVCSKHLSI
jgi:hypothetical protein